MAILPPGELTFDVRPVVETDLLERHPNAQFWVGRTAVFGTIEYPDLQDGAAQLRGNVYVYECNFLEPEHLDEAGREKDEYDDQSVHWAVAEKDEEDVTRIVGSMRLIMSDPEELPLPIEEHFPELFEDRIATGSAEVSRFISRHEDKKIMQHVVAMSLIRAVVLYAQDHNIEDFYCLIEEPLMRRLSYIGIPLESMADPKDIPELGGILYPIHIKPQEIVDSLSTSNKGSLLEAFFEGEHDTRGEGFYPSELMGGHRG